MYFRVTLGSHRYAKEATEYINARTAEEACTKAIRLNKGMRYAFAQSVKLTKETIENIIEADGYIVFNKNKLWKYNNGYVIDFSSGSSEYIKTKACAINRFIFCISRV